MSAFLSEVHAEFTPPDLTTLAIFAFVATFAAMIGLVHWKTKRRP